MRIVSLLAGATELVCALGAGDELVGRSHECDFPEWVRRLPSCTSPTFDLTGTSRQIDQLVRQALREGKPLYRVDGELLRRLEPDVIISQAHCDVCAAGPADLRRDAGDIGGQPRVVDLTAATLDQMFRAFVTVARAIGRGEEGRRLVDNLRARLDKVAERVADEPRPSVVCLEWMDPIFVMSNWGPRLVEIAGGESLLGSAGEHSHATDWDRVDGADPDYLVIAPCGFGLERTVGEMLALTARPGWNELRAVRRGQVVLADGNRYFNRSGPSVVDTAEILGEILHPHLFPPLHQGHAWIAPSMVAAGRSMRGKYCRQPARSDNQGGT